MVSVNPNPFSQSFSFSSSSPSSFGPMKYSLLGIEPLPPPHTAASSGATTAIDVVAHGSSTASSEDPSKKIRKPYTITKSRESWTEQEHDKFLEALQLFDRDWKKIEAFVGSKSVIQIRSHAQKYFLKVQKNGATEHLPPPRPKRKAAHPYPQKASKNAPVVSKGVESFQSSTALLEPGYVLRPDSSSVLGNSNVALSSWTYNVPPVKMAHMEKDSKELLQPAYNYCCSSSSENPRGWAAGEANDEGNHNQPERVMPDFAQVYSFIGSVFDPDESDDLQKLKKMDPINVETVLLLMRNLSVNLTSPEFEDHRKLISSYGIKSHSAVSDGVQGNFHTDKLENAISSA